jgi:hypothetical protein
MSPNTGGAGAHHGTGTHIPKKDHAHHSSASLPTAEFTLHRPVGRRGRWLVWVAACPVCRCATAHYANRPIWSGSRIGSCGHAYQLQPAQVSIYGRDHDDLGHWCDEDGVVRQEDGSPLVRIPEQTQARKSVSA